MNLERRSLGLGLLAFMAAPSIIRIPGILMPVKSLGKIGYKAVSLIYADGTVDRFVTDTGLLKVGKTGRVDFVRISAGNFDGSAYLYVPPVTEGNTLALKITIESMAGEKVMLLDGVALKA